MGEPVKHEGKLSGVQFLPGVAVTVGGRWTALMYWDRKKHCDDAPNGQKVHVEELKNGDLRLKTDDGFYRDVYPWAIAWRMYEPERVIRGGNSVIPEPKR